MSWEDVENAMQAAVSKASGYPADRVFWSYQNINEPAASTDFIVITFRGEIVVGVDRINTEYDGTRPVGQEIKQEIRGVREVPFELSCYTSTTSGNVAARRILELVRTRLRLPTVRDGLHKVGLSPFDSGPVNYVPDMPATNFRGRATCTVRCYVPVTDCAEYVPYIARVRGTVFPVGWIGTPSGVSGLAFDSDNG